MEKRGGTGGTPLEPSTSIWGTIRILAESRAAKCTKYLQITLKTTLNNLKTLKNSLEVTYNFLRGILRQSSGSLAMVGLPKRPEAASHLCVCLTTLRLPNKCQAPSQLSGCPQLIDRLPHHNCEGASKLWKVLTILCLPQNCESAHNYEPPHNCEASSQLLGFITTVRLINYSMGSSQL